MISRTSVLIGNVLKLAAPFLSLLIQNSSVFFRLCALIQRFSVIIEVQQYILSNHWYNQISAEVCVSGHLKKKIPIRNKWC